MRHISTALTHKPTSPYNPYNMLHITCFIYLQPLPINLRHISTALTHKPIYLQPLPINASYIYMLHISTALTHKLASYIYNPYP